MSKKSTGMEDLQKWTVITLLGLLVFVTAVNVVDDIFLGNKFVVDAAFYALIGGMIGGLFTGRVIASLRGAEKEDDDDRPSA